MNLGPQKVLGCKSTSDPDARRRRSLRIFLLAHFAIVALLPLRSALLEFFVLLNRKNKIRDGYWIGYNILIMQASDKSFGLSLLTQTHALLLPINYLKGDPSLKNRIS